MNPNAYTFVIVVNTSGFPQYPTQPGSLGGIISPFSLPTTATGFPPIPIQVLLSQILHAVGSMQPHVLTGPIAPQFAVSGHVPTASDHVGSPCNQQIVLPPLPYDNLPAYVFTGVRGVGGVGDVDRNNHER